MTKRLRFFSLLVASVFSLIVLYCTYVGADKNNSKIKDVVSDKCICYEGEDQSTCSARCGSNKLNNSAIKAVKTENNTKMAKSVLFLLSEGSEEMESTITIDVLRRAGINVTVAGLQGGQPLLCSRNVVIKPDVALDDIKDKLAFDAIVLPGGNDGSHNFATSPLVQKLLQDYYNAKKLVAAICAAPTAIIAAGIHKNGKITSYPTLEAKFTDYQYQQDRVVVDGNVLTSRGPGTTFEFALAIVKYLADAETAKKVAGGMVLTNDILATL